MTGRPLRRRGVRACLWLLGLLLLVLSAASRAQYDQEAEIGRLIERATAEKRDVTAGLTGLRATRDRLRQQFLFINDTEQQLAGNLQRIRAVDARNKAMLVISTGLNITAVNAPEKLAEAATSVVVDVASEYLRNNFPALFDTSVTVVLPKLGLNGVEAMRAFNTTMALTDAAVEQRIFAEDPAFAQDVANRGWLQKTLSGDKLSDQLIALKRAQFQIRDGTLAEQALEQLKRELLARQVVLLQAIAVLEQEEQRLEETIQSWVGHLRGVRVASDVPPEPQAAPVVRPSGPLPDFGAAAAAMQDALARLKANQIDCNGYDALVWGASWSAGELLQRLWASQVRDVCDGNGWGGPACSGAMQRFEATIRPDYEARVGGAQRYLSEQFSAERPVVERFMASLRAWREQKITVPYFGVAATTSFQPGSGEDAADAIWSGSEIALPPSYLDSYDMQLVRGGPPLLPVINQALTVVIAHGRELDKDLAMARSADNLARSIGATAAGLAQQWEPRLYFWSCVAGTQYWDDQRWLRQLKAFPTVYAVRAETGRQAAQRYREAVGARQAVLASLASAYRDEAAIVRARVEAEDLRMRLLEVGRDSGVSLRSPDAAYALWGLMTKAGVTQAMLKELSDVNPQLGNEPFVLDYVLGLRANQDPRRQPVLASAALARLRADLTATAARVVPTWNDYQSLYAQLRRKQSEIDSRHQALRSAVEAVLGEPADYLAPPQILDPRYLMDAADLPDPTAGVFEQLDAYEKLAREYHARVDPLHPASFPLVQPMEALVVRLQQGRGRLMGLEESAFVQQLNAYMTESETLMARAVQAGGTMGPAALFAKARARLMVLHGDISGAYFQGRAIGEVTRQLSQLVADVGGFLAGPPAAGGTSVAGDWVLRVDEAIAPAGRASGLRSDSGVASLLERLAALRARLVAYQESGGDALVRKLYQDFATAYQARNLRGVLRFMTPDWRASDGSDLRDLEDILDNSFRVFNSIVFAMSGLSITPAGDGRFTVRYAATITGRINQMNLNHQETAQVEDTVILTPSGPRIQASHGGRIWLKR